MKHKDLPTQERLRELFNYDPITGILSRRIKVNNVAKIGDVPTYTDKDGYLSIGVDYVSHRVHRLIYKWVHGDFNKDLQIDHIDRNVKNNRIENLRLVTPRENSLNRKKFRTNTSGCTGIDKKNGKWRVRINDSGVRKEIGYFDNLDEAIKARRNYENELGYFRD